MRSLLCAVLIVLVGLAASAESAVSEHKKKWDAARDREPVRAEASTVSDDRDLAPRQDSRGQKPESRAKEPSTADE